MILNDVMKPNVAGAVSSAKKTWMGLVEGPPEFPTGLCHALRNRSDYATGISRKLAPVELAEYLTNRRLNPQADHREGGGGGGRGPSGVVCLPKPHLVWVSKHFTF